MIEARVKAVSGSTENIEAGVMIRDSQAPDSKCVMIGLTGTGQAFFHVRSETGEKAIDPIRKSLAGNPNYVRLIREGEQFIGSVSSDGKKWQQVFRKNVEMNTTASYGLCVTSNKPGVLATASFDQVTAEAK